VIQQNGHLEKSEIISEGVVRLMGNQRKSYGKETKKEVVEFVNSQGYSVSHAAQNLGIDSNILARRRLKPRIFVPGRSLFIRFLEDGVSPDSRSLDDCNLTKKTSARGNSSFRLGNLTSL
jgi:hypothetical protein